MKKPSPGYDEGFSLNFIEDYFNSIIFLTKNPSSEINL